MFFGRSVQSGNSPLEMSTSRRNNASDGVFAAAADFTADFAVVINESTSDRPEPTLTHSFSVFVGGGGNRSREEQREAPEKVNITETDLPGSACAGCPQKSMDDSGTVPQFCGVLFVHQMKMMSRVSEQKCFLPGGVA